MTHKYERKCWSCGSDDLMPDIHGVRCRSCGATWNKIAEIHNPNIVRGTTTVLVAGEPFKVRGYHVSPAAARRAARARGELPPKRRPKSEARD